MCVWGVMGYAEITAGRHAFTAWVTAIEPSMTLVILLERLTANEAEDFVAFGAIGSAIDHPSSITIRIASAGHSRAQIPHPLQYS
jgi:hypothetical protein